MSERSDLAAHVEALAGAAVLCVGDLMLDRFVRGAVDRISPEAPIPVFRIEDEDPMPGGAGNVVRNLAALGARCRFVGVVGDDEAGREVAALLGAEPGVAADLVSVSDRPTTVKTRYLAGGQHILRADRERVRPLEEGAARAVVAHATRALAECDVVVLSDYGKGVLGGAVAQAVIGAAREAGRPVVVDPKGRDHARYRGATVLTPNRRELAEATNRAADTDAEIAVAAAALLDACAADSVLVTRGRDGMTLATKDGAAEHLSAAAREVFDVSGAGDTVAATLAAGLAAGVPLAAAARLANTAAGIVVGKVGTAVVHPGELFAALHRQDLLAAEEKVLPPPEAIERVALWRRQSLRVGFTNGVFDLLHPGHVSLLRQARAACDRLVVALNSDASTRRVKGADRPVQGEAARAAVLASLAAVDLVVVFSEDTPMKLIEAIRPDVLVKGADYRIDQVVGAGFVQDYGGRVLLADISPGHSTTATIARLAK